MESENERITTETEWVTTPKQRILSEGRQSFDNCPPSMELTDVASAAAAAAAATTDETSIGSPKMASILATAIGSADATD